MKEIIGIAGGIISGANLVFFAWQILVKKVEAPSIASWVLWTVLDVMLLITTVISGKPMWLPLSYTIGATAVTALCLVRGKWSWSYKETVCAVATVIAAYFWQTQGASVGVLAGVVAMTVAGTPLYIDMIREPIRGTFYVWAVTALACVLTLLASDWSFIGTILAWGGLVFNGSLALIVLRGK